MRPSFLLFALIGLRAFPSTVSPELAQLKRCTEDLAGLKSHYELGTFKQILATVEPRLGNMLEGSEVVQANAQQLENLLAKGEGDSGLSHLVANAAVGCEAYQQQLQRYMKRATAFGSMLVLTLLAFTVYYFYLTREILAGSRKD